MKNMEEVRSVCESNEIMVTVYCLAYNHAKYIRKCLDGFVKQKTTFKFEVLVHDDASTDETPSIILEYAEKYPEIIKPILQKKNQYSQGVSILWKFLLPIAKGKYMASCEGDDYWTSEYKLQRQFDAMEGNPECTICVCREQFMKESGELLDQYRPEMSYPIREGVQDSNWLISRIPEYSFQTATFFWKRDTYLYVKKEYPEVLKALGASKVTYLMLISVGKCYFVDEVMVNYRVNSIGSWTQNQRKMRSKLVHYKKLSNFYRIYDDYLKKNYREYDKLDLEGLYKTIDYNDVFVASNNGEFMLLMTREYRRKLKMLFGIKGRVYFIIKSLVTKKQI